MAVDAVFVERLSPSISLVTAKYTRNIHKFGLPTNRLKRPYVPEI